MFVVVPWPVLVPVLFVQVDLFVFVRLVFVGVQLCLVDPFVCIQFDCLVFDQVLVGHFVLMLPVQV